MERQIQLLATHACRLIAFIIVGVAASLVTRELGGKLDTQIMIGAAFLATLAGGYVFKHYWGDIMRLGLGLPQFGDIGTAQNIAKLARFAEDEGFDSVWVIERQLFPLNPQTKYPPTPDGSFPKVYQKSLDPIETLTFVAAITKRIRLGTGAVDMLYQNPTILAKRLATLDVLSGGRLLAGLALGHSKDEFDAVGVSFTNRGKRADETLDVLKKIWTREIIEHHGEFFSSGKIKVHGNMADLVKFQNCFVGQ